MLITPASTALLLNDDLKKVLVIAGFIGMLSALLGMIGAIIFDTPPGPAMVVIATLIYFIVAFASPKKGIAIRYFRKRRQKVKIEQEDILRQAIKQPNHTFDTSILKQRLGYTDGKIKTRIREMIQSGLLSTSGNQISLTAKGEIAADTLVRAHRLWEAYQVEHMGLGEEQIHDEADRLEHHLTDEVLDEVDHILGYPETDPHGSPIPKKGLRLKYSLLGLKPMSRAYIKEEQPSSTVESDLWELGLTHEDVITIKSIGKDQITISQRGKELNIPASLARDIEVKV